MNFSDSRKIHTMVNLFNAVDEDVKAQKASVTDVCYTYNTFDYMVYDFLSKNSEKDITNMSVDLNTRKSSAMITPAIQHIVNNMQAFITLVDPKIKTMSFADIIMFTFKQFINSNANFVRIQGRDLNYCEAYNHGIHTTFEILPPIYKAIERDLRILVESYVCKLSLVYNNVIEEYENTELFDYDTWGVNINNAYDSFDMLSLYHYAFREEPNEYYQDLDDLIDAVVKSFKDRKDAGEEFSEENLFFIEKASLPFDELFELVKTIKRNYVAYRKDIAIMTRTDNKNLNEFSSRLLKIIQPITDLDNCLNAYMAQYWSYFKKLYLDSKSCPLSPLEDGYLSKVVLGISNGSLVDSANRDFTLFPLIDFIAYTRIAFSVSPQGRDLFDEILTHLDLFGDLQTIEFSDLNDNGEYKSNNCYRIMKYFIAPDFNEYASDLIKYYTVTK